MWKQIESKRKLVVSTHGRDFVFSFHMGMSRGLKQSISENRTPGERLHCYYRRIYFRLVLRACASPLIHLPVLQAMTT